MNTELSGTGLWSSGRLLDRILNIPQIAQVVPRLQPEVLHRVIQHCGLEDSGDLVALATPGQLAHVFDLDLWRSVAPGLDEQFDSNRFGLWLEVMVETGVSTAATTLAAMDVELIAAGFVQHVRIFACVAVTPYMTLDGEEMSPGPALDHRLRCEIGGYVVWAMRNEFWDAITAVMMALADAHGAFFKQLMRECCRLSNSLPEVDGLDDLLSASDQAVFDQALDREARRETQGYVSPVQARAFLETSRRIDIRQAAITPRDPMTRAYFRGIDARTATERHGKFAALPALDRAAPAPDTPPETVAAVIDVLHEAGVIPRAPRALLEAPQTSAPRVARIRTHLQFAHDHDSDAYAMRHAELAYLANVIVAGATIQSRPVAPEEASNAAVAVCNLGLENWPVYWLASEDPRRISVTDPRLVLPDDFLIHHDLVSVFQVGWTILHEDVCMYAADKLISMLTSIHSADVYLQEALDTLRVTLTEHWRAGSPWNGREALDVIAMLDTPAWAAVRGLIDEFPTLHAAVGALLSGTIRQVDASAFEFISENRQIRKVHDFMQRLPAILGS